ncbi:MULTISPECIES: DUF998 domain-containing protein [Pseudoalteromonas]|uniref:DUF998 domain-containing protein n=1 Tax=Pseudoalteromonas TaxID=53246 RepID=UPI00026CBE79|nr:DUF998 domain-containing protein [Pseudoalteromonas spongiae]ATD01209.1 hypothetical protein PSPO_b1342 [Pseudoalteromonas spongiae UST010723-006]
MFEKVAVYSGLIATVWIVLGVFIAGRYYAGYNHAKQFCSELGAAGCPTEKLSPRINNYPLGLLFCFFGWYLIQLPNVSLLVTGAGWCVIAHGLATWVAGYFPMDADPFTENPSFNCKIHTVAGIVMLLSLLVAPILVALSPTSDVISQHFKVFSWIMVVAAVVFLLTMTRAINQQTNPGIHQRLSYGAQLIWLTGLSLVLA